MAWRWITRNLQPTIPTQVQTCSCVHPSRRPAERPHHKPADLQLHLSLTTPVPLPIRSLLLPISNVLPAHPPMTLRMASQRPPRLANPVLALQYILTTKAILHCCCPRHRMVSSTFPLIGVVSVLFRSFILHIRFYSQLILVGKMLISIVHCRKNLRRRIRWRRLLFIRMLEHVPRWIDHWLGSQEG
jgi:hypothetical protein